MLSFLSYYKLKFSKIFANIDSFWMVSFPPSLFLQIFEKNPMHVHQNLLEKHFIWLTFCKLCRKTQKTCQNVCLFFVNLEV